MIICDVCKEPADNTIKVKIMDKESTFDFCDKCVEYASFNAFRIGMITIVNEDKKLQSNHKIN